MKSYFVIFTVLAASFSLLLGQESNIPLFDVRNEKFQGSMETFYQKRSLTRTMVTQVLENELEETDYVVGPGDRFLVHIFDELGTEFSVSVTPQGTALVPTVGEYPLHNLSLKKAKEKLLKAVKESYPRNRVAVNLTGLRKFRVYLTGAVQRPGVYFVQGVDRLGDVLDVAAISAQQALNKNPQITAKAVLQVPPSGLTDWADETRIQVRHSDGSQAQYDFTRFLTAGDKSQNPLLKAGDIIYAQPVSYENPYVIIEGNIPREGVYALRENEDLESLLSRTYGLNAQSELSAVILLRDGKKQVLNYLDKHDKYAKFVLQSGDRLTIPQKNEQVYVAGEVLNPGAFPYVADFRVRDYAGLAGAKETAKDVGDYMVIRKDSGEILEGADIIVYRGDTVVIPRRMRENIKDYIAILSPILSILIATLALLRK